jgi:chromosome segregation ATPase
MKTIFVCLFALILASCHNYKNDAERLEVVVDSLKTKTLEKDSTIEVFLNDFAEIQANLDSIKKMEMFMTGAGDAERVMNDSDKEKILSDIATINGLLRDNQKLIANLRTRLSNTNLKTGRLEEMVNKLEVQTKSLQENLETKDREINRLGEQVLEKNQSISELELEIDQMTTYRSLLRDSLKMQEAELNRAFFTMGSISELKNNEIVEREGGILGIGSTPVIRKDFPRDNFTPTDIRVFRFLPLDARKAEVLSVHPAGSFHISGDNRADTLFVDNPEAFWSVTNYLVVTVK